MSDHDTWNMFAAAALTGLAKDISDDVTTHRTKSIVSASCDLADALLAESKKRETPAPLSTKPIAWLRDLDGTGSLHPASKGDPGAFPVYGEPAQPTPPQPDDDGWIKHDGKSVPVALDAIVDVMDDDGYVWERQVVGLNSSVEDAFWLWAADGNRYVSKGLRVVKYRIVSEAGVTK